MKIINIQFFFKIPLPFTTWNYKPSQTIPARPNGPKKGTKRKKMAFPFPIREFSRFFFTPARQVHNFA